MGRRRDPTMAGALVAVGLVAGLLWPRLTCAPERGAGTACPPPAWAVAFIDGQVSPLPLFGYPMPNAPFEEQMKPPCDEGPYVEVQGGCWVLTRQDAPCSVGAAEYEGKCYVAVRKKKPERRSIKQ